jgi:hypothetical protein
MAVTSDLQDVDPANPPRVDPDPPPRHRVEFELKCGAESRKDLARQLEQLAFEIDAGKLNGPTGAWGGCGTSGHYSFNEDATIEAEAYRLSLMAWSERRRQERAAREASA